MKIKSLLLGSAAAMVAVSAAQAADKVEMMIPEPEVVEYVRVCDAYGTGYYYIPGTETCMRIHGYIRMDIGFGELNGVKDISIDDLDTYETTDDVLTVGDDTWRVRSRASFRVSTARDTEYGPLRTYIETRWQYDTNGSTPFAAEGFATGDLNDGLSAYSTTGEFSINFAYIDLNGLRMGKSESLFTTFTGYAGGVINDTTGGGYGPFDTNLIQYTYTGGAFTLAAAVEQQAGSVLIDDYAPHFVVGAGYDAGIVNVRGVAGFDTVNDTWAGKVRVDADITDMISGFIMGMYGEAGSGNGYASWLTNSADTWSVIGGATLSLTDDTDINAQVQWAEGNGGDDIWAVAANVNHNLVDGMIVRPEVQWLRNGAGESAWGGTVRFQVSY